MTRHVYYIRFEGSCNGYKTSFSFLHVVDAMPYFRSFILSFAISLTHRAATIVMMLGDRDAPGPMIRHCGHHGHFVLLSFNRRNRAVTSPADIIGLVHGIVDLCEDLDDDDKASLLSLRSIFVINP